MKIQLDPKLCNDLRDKINEHHNFSYEKSANFKFPNSKKDVRVGAYNCICATLDRISDLVEHCNSIEIKGQFGLCDFFNYTQSLIECITVLGRVYNVTPLYRGTDKKDTSIFHQTGNNGDGNDEKYFTYLRSLCSVHPVETSRHKEYQGNEAEWCPYIIAGSHSMFVRFSDDIPDFEDADFVATVYRNDLKLGKYVPIHVNELIAYVQKRYNHINAIINAIDTYNNELIDEFKLKPISSPDSFSDYIDYLENFQIAITERCGKNNSNKTKEWICIFKAHFDDETMQKHLINYQSAMKKGISEIHQKLQNMEIDFYFEDEPICVDTSFIKNGYAMENRWGLQEYFWSLSTEDAIDYVEKGITRFENERIDNMLKMVSDARRNGATEDELMYIAREIDHKYSTTNSEWARIMLKIIEPNFNNIVEFDYHLDDWYLNLQVEIAFWLINQNS